MQTRNSTPKQDRQFPKLPTNGLIFHPKTKWLHHGELSTLHLQPYGAQIGLYTTTGRGYAFSGERGRGVTTGGGVVSRRTTSACLRQ